MSMMALGLSQWESLVCEMKSTAEEEDGEETKMTKKARWVESAHLPWII